jgi:hypothetical protein
MTCRILLALLLLVVVPATAQQYARPDGDEDNATYFWDTPGASTAHWSDIDEATPDAVAEIAEDDGSVYRGTLSDVTDPASSSDHILRCYVYRTSNKANTFTMELYESGTQRATNGGVTVTNGSPAAAQAYTLSGAEADAITNYANLEIRLTATGTTPTDIFVDQCEFQVPAAAASEEMMVIGAP